MALALLPLVQCDAPRRENPFDPGRDGGVPALALSVPLPKALAAVVGRVEALLAGPGMHPVVKVLEHQPLGPARGVIGALQPGEGRVLTVRGFDLDGVLLFEGETRGIAVTAGDTLRLVLDLFLVSLDAGDRGEPDEPNELAPEDSDGENPDSSDPDAVAPEDPGSKGNESEGNESEGGEAEGNESEGGEADGGTTAEPESDAATEDGAVADASDAPSEDAP